MTHRTSTVFQFVLSIVALFSVSSCGLIALAAGFFQQGMRIPGYGDPLAMYIWAAGFGLIAALLLPSIWFSYRALQGASAPAPLNLPPMLKIIGPSLLFLILFPLILTFGSWAQQASVARWLLPWLNLLAAGLPVYWISQVAISNLRGGSPQRTWGVFASGLLLGPQLIVLAEMLMVGIAILVFAVYLSSQPELAADLENLVQRLPIVMNSPARLSNLLEPYLSNPVLIISLVGFIAVIVPVIEETLKPIGVWLLAGRNLSPTEGFIAGAISGAGYALFESLFLPFSGDGWAVLMFGRLGTSAIHILTTALTGWGLAYAWRDGNYLRLGLQFLAAITLHAAWNAITVLNTAAILIPASMLTSLATRWLPYALALMAVACIILLYVFNRRLAAAAAIQAAQASTELTPVS